MPTIVTFLLRLVLLVAGLVAAAGIAFAFVVVLAYWGARAAWGRLTGRPASPFIMRINPRAGFDSMYRHAGGGGRTPRADSLPAGRNLPDVTDVEPKRR